MPRLIRSASLLGFRETVRAAGADPERLVREAGLPPACLRDPDLRLSTLKVARLLENAARELGLETLGLQMAQTRTASNLGPLGLAVREEPTLRAALHAMVRYSHLQNEALLLRVDEADGIAIVREDLAVDQPMVLRQSTELVIGVIFRLMQFFLGPQWRPHSVCFAHSAPSDRALHERVFGRQLHFGHEFTGIVCTSRDLDLPLPSSDPVMARYARQYLDFIGGKRNKPMSDDVRKLVILLLPSGQCTLENIARHLGVHRRTVLRRLTAEGETYADVLNTVRRELVARLLDRRERPLAEISSLLGFAEPSAFSHWFRTQFGCSARHYEARLESEDT